MYAILRISPLIVQMVKVELSLTLMTFHTAEYLTSKLSGECTVQ